MRKEIRQQIDAVKANKKILNSGGKIFYAEFIKRSNGEIRKMWARLGVKKYLKGGDKAYSDKEHNLITVFDMEKKGYRCIPIENLQVLSINGNRYKVRRA